jgi:hypothetical protein
MSKIRKLLVMTVVFLFISSYAIVLIPFSDFDEGGAKMVLSYSISAAFYIFMIVGYILFIAANKKRKKMNQKIPGSKPGIIVFFSSAWAVCADIVLILGIIFIVIMLMMPYLFSEIVQYVVIATFIFSLHMHCLLNGVNYRIAFLKENKKGEKKQK